MGCPPVPEFWLIDYPWNINPKEITEIVNSLKELGFCLHTVSFPNLIVYHSKKKYISLWMLKHSELILRTRLSVKYYIHNTRRSKKELARANQAKTKEYA